MRLVVIHKTNNIYEIWNNELPSDDFVTVIYGGAAYCPLPYFPS